MRVNGTVKWFNVRKGYGFLCDEDGAEHFVHYSEIRTMGFRKLEEGQAVTFEIGEDLNGRSVPLKVEPVQEPEPEEEP